MWSDAMWCNVISVFKRNKNPWIIRNILKLNKTCRHIIMCNICIWKDIYIYSYLYMAHANMYIYIYAINNYMYIYYIYMPPKIQTWRYSSIPVRSSVLILAILRFLRGATSLTASFLDSFILAMTCFSFSSRFLIAGWQSWDFSNGPVVDLTWLAYQAWWLSRYWKLLCKIFVGRLTSTYMDLHGSIVWIYDDLW